jgi:hypothetical protein
MKAHVMLAAWTALAAPGTAPRARSADPRVDPHAARPRVVVMTDIANEPDDQMSMVRLLLYSNQLDLEGLIATTSTEMKSRIRPDVLLQLIDAYDSVRPNLLKHSPAFPDAASLRRLVTPGQPGYGMEAVGPGKSSPGADLILRAARKSEARPLWVLAWGGTNTLAQALVDARASRQPAELEAIVAKLRVYSISDQDDAGPWIRREFPGLSYIVSPSTPDGEEYYFATWTGISGDRFYRNAPGADFTTFSDEWVDANIRGKGPLGELYPHPCCIHEGDTPSFLGLIDNGLASAMSPAFGGWGGRYVWRQPSGETRPFWTQGGDSYPGRDSSRDTVVGADGQAYTSDQATIWRWRRAFQNDFAARMDWTIKGPREANHNPRVVVDGRRDRAADHRRARRHAPHRGRLGHRRPRRQCAHLPLVLLSGSGDGNPRSARSGPRAPARAGPRRQHPLRPRGRAAAAASARRRPERDEPAGHGRAEGSRHRPRHPGRGGRRGAELDLLPPRHPAHPGRDRSGASLERRPLKRAALTRHGPGAPARGPPGASGCAAGDAPG